MAGCYVLTLLFFSYPANAALGPVAVLKASNHRFLNSCHNRKCLCQCCMELYCHCATWEEKLVKQHMAGSSEGQQDDSRGCRWKVEGQN